MRISVALVSNLRPLTGAEWQAVSDILPASLISDSRRFRRWQDRQAHLFGRLLLLNLLPGLDPLNDIVYDRFRRPVLRDSGSGDFNITHTRGLIACAFHPVARVGIDAEYRLPLRQLSDFRRVFTDREYRYISAGTPPDGRFYRLWTRKEAVMKADGRGFYLDPSGISALAEPVRVDGVSYRVAELDDGECSIHLASTRPFDWEHRRFTLASLLEHHGYRRGGGWQRGPGTTGNG